MRIITLTTDFGTTDYYVGVMKGIILAHRRDLQLVDLSHDIAPQDVLSGAFLLRHATPAFPPGTIHLGIVDPGVGSSRRPLVVEAHGHLWVGPDNGLFSYALSAPDCEVHTICVTNQPPTEISNTFHGRDLFAPAAAHLALGATPAAFGSRVTNAQRLEVFPPEATDCRIVGKVMQVDHFGNLVTNISETAISGKCIRLQFGSGIVIDGLTRSYSDAKSGSVLALIGSVGLLEIAVNGGSAAQQLNIGRGDAIQLELIP